MTTPEWYWFAGLAEGEGYFGIKKHGQCSIDIKMTDRDVLERAAWLFGSHVNGPYQQRNVKHSDYWSFNLCGRKAAGVMMALYPLLGSRRRAKIRTVLATWRKHGIRPECRTHCPAGHSYSPENTYAGQNAGGRYRICRTCQNEKRRGRVVLKHRRKP